MKKISMMLTLAMVMFFAMGSFLGDQYITLLNLVVLVIGVAIGLAIIHFVRR